MRAKAEFRLEKAELTSFLRANRWWLLISNLLLLLIWSPWIFDITPKIDTEVLINTPGTPYNWLEIGRQGGILTEYVFGQRWFNPYAAIAGGYLLLCVAGSLLGYLFWRAGRRNQRLCCILGLLCFAAPLMAEQFYFQLQVLEIAWAYILCATAVGLSYAALLRHNWSMQIAATVCMVWCFSTYQSFVPLYVAIVVCVFLLLYRRWTLDGEKPMALYGRLVAGLIVSFLAAFAVNMLITKLFFSGGSYLEEQIAWLTQPVDQCLRNVLFHLKNGFLGNSPFFTGLYGAAALSVMVVATVRVWRSPCRRSWGLYLAVALGLQLTPFLLTIVLGTAPTCRAQIVYPMVLACDLLLLVDLVGRKYLLRGAALVLTGVTCWTQVCTTERLLYTDAVRAQEDIRLASEMECRIAEVAEGDKPLAIVGIHKAKLNNAALRGEMIGISAFGFTPQDEPHYYFSGVRGIKMFQTLGYDWIAASAEQVQEARRKALDMPSWPAKGSVVDAGDYIIVKLSEDNWAEELIGTALEQVDMPEDALIADSESVLRVAVDSLSIESDSLTIQGWAILPGQVSEQYKTAMYLRDKDTGEYLRIPTVRKHRPDLVGALENGALYEYAGYYAKGDISGLPKPLQSYELYIGIECGGTITLSNTGYVL